MELEKHVRMLFKPLTMYCRDFLKISEHIDDINNNPKRYNKTKRVANVWAPMADICLISFVSYNTMQSIQSEDGLFYGGMAITFTLAKYLVCNVAEEGLAGANKLKSEYDTNIEG